MPKSNATAPTALITGASSGIGEALADCFAQAGYNLVLVARSADQLKALASELETAHRVQAWVEPADLAQVEAAAKVAAVLKRKRRPPVEVRLNNAGVLEQGAFVQMDAARHQQIIALNIAGITAACPERLIVRP